MTGLRISPDLVLPLDMVTEPIGILANRGRGKSYSTHVLVEEIHNADVPVVVLDVKGDWWGLRSSADGKADGLPFYIFGGDHADLPLEATAGELLADLVVDERVSVVLDLSHMSKTKARSFTVAFAERLYHRNRDPLFVVVDEADVLIPQRATAETARLLGAMEDIAKRGRGRGIGMAVVTQRPQEVAKSVLDLMDTLILLGMTGPRSLKSISEWISTHVDEDTTAAEVMATLPSLPVGNAWVWSPMQGLLQRVAVRQIRTFDSHVTPKPGQKRTAPGGRVALDLDALGERITATVERAKADDPKALHARIRELENQVANGDRDRLRQITDLQDQLGAARLATYVLDRDLLLASLTEHEQHLRLAIDSVTEIFTAVRGGAFEVPMLDRDVMGSTPHTPLPSRQPRPAASTPTGASRAPRTAAPARVPTPTAGQGDHDTTLSKAQRKILSVLAQHGTRSTTQVAILTGYSHKSGGYRNALSALRTAGFMDGRGDVEITEAGLSALGDYEPLPTGRDLLDWWKANHLSKAERAIVDVLDAHGGGPVDVATIAAESEYSASSGGFRNALSRLRSLELASGRGELTLNSELMGRP